VRPVNGVFHCLIGKIGGSRIERKDQGMPMIIEISATSGKTSVFCNTLAALLKRYARIPV
jgi:hypothetical protein